MRAVSEIVEHPGRDQFGDFRFHRGFLQEGRHGSVSGKGKGKGRWGRGGAGRPTPPTAGFREASYL